MKRIRRSCQNGMTPVFFSLLREDFRPENAFHDRVKRMRNTTGPETVAPLDTCLFCDRKQRCRKRFKRRDKCRQDRLAQTNDLLSTEAGNNRVDQGFGWRGLPRKASAMYAASLMQAAACIND
jgi:hypothetical protein